MKKLITLIALILILQSCGHRVPIIDGDVPFVVGSIVKLNDTQSIYTATDYDSGLVTSGAKRPQIVAPIGIYQINDTIRVY